MVVKLVCGLEPFIAKVAIVLALRFFILWFSFAAAMFVILVILVDLLHTFLFHLLPEDLLLFLLYLE